MGTQVIDPHIESNFFFFFYKAAIVIYCGKKNLINLVVPTWISL